MNMRIEGQQLRFRISQEELRALCSGVDISQVTMFPDNRVLKMNITLKNIIPMLQIRFENDCMILAVQKQAADDLYHQLPCREGIQVRQTLDSQQTLELTLEVDIRTQKRSRRGRD